jgi:hypothetical protein
MAVSTYRLIETLQHRGVLDASSVVDANSMPIGAFDCRQPRRLGCAVRRCRAGPGRRFLPRAAADRGRGLWSRRQCELLCAGACSSYGPLSSRQSEPGGPTYAGRGRAACRQLSLQHRRARRERARHHGPHHGDRAAHRQPQCQIRWPQVQLARHCECRDHDLPRLAHLAGQNLARCHDHGAGGRRHRRGRNRSFPRR